MAEPERKPVKRVERVVFDWEKNYVPKVQTEPPLPVSSYARDHVPNDYVYDGLDTPRVVAARAKRPSVETSQFADLRTTWTQKPDTYVRRADTSPMNRGDAAAATWIFRGSESGAAGAG